MRGGSKGYTAGPALDPPGGNGCHILVFWLPAGPAAVFHIKKPISVHEIVPQIPGSVKVGPCPRDPGH